MDKIFDEVIGDLRVTIIYDDGWFTDEIRCHVNHIPELSKYTTSARPQPKHFFVGDSILQIVDDVIGNVTIKFWLDEGWFSDTWRFRIKRTPKT